MEEEMDEYVNKTADQIGDWSLIKTQSKEEYIELLGMMIERLSMDQQQAEKELEEEDE